MSEPMTKEELDKMVRPTLEERWRNILCTVPEGVDDIDVEAFIASSIDDTVRQMWSHYGTLRRAIKNHREYVQSQMEAC